MNFTVADILGVGAGFVLFGLFAFAPGYTFGWLTDVFQFRERRLATRIALAVPLSIGLMPITAYLLWHVWLGLVWIAFGLSGAACVVLLARDWRRLGLRLGGAGWKVAAIAAGWVLVGTLSLVDLQFGHRLYYAVSAHDRETRAAFTAAILRTGIPPHNPYFFLGQPAPLRYHYFWLIPAALVEGMGGTLVSARLSLIDGVLWSGLGVMALIAIYLRFFQEGRRSRIEQRTLIGVALLGITGLDILPVLSIDLASHGLMASIEWWNMAIASWINTVLWVPQDLAGLTAGLTGFLLVWESVRERRRLQRIAAVAAGGLAFASSAGLSIYVAGTIAMGCLLWLCIAMMRRWWRHATLMAVAGLLSAVLLLPWVWQIMHGVHAMGTVGGGTSSFPFTFGVRSFMIPDELLPKNRPWLEAALNAVLLPLNYFLELGFFMAVANLKLQQLRQKGHLTQTQWGAAALGGASLLVCTFCSSTIIRNNDLATRSPLIVQFLLLLLAAEMWSEGTIGFGWKEEGGPGLPRRTAPVLISVTLVLGALGSCYELIVQRAYPILSDVPELSRMNWPKADHTLALRTYAMRSAYLELNRMLPASAVVQADPRGGIGNVAAELYSGRQMVADSGDCGTVFGGSEPYCKDVILPALKPLFDDKRPVSLGEVEQTCREFSITALLFEDTDPVWKDKSSWIWRVTPMINNGFVRVIRCDGEGGDLQSSR